MITLFHCMSARSFRPLWTLEELGLSCKLNTLSLPPRFHPRQYLNINRIGMVPALIIDKILMTKSAAICEYLAKLFGPTPLGVLPEEPDYAKYLNWLHYGEAPLHFFKRSSCGTDNLKNHQGVCRKQFRTTHVGSWEGCELLVQHWVTESTSVRTDFHGC